VAVDPPSAAGEELVAWARRVASVRRASGGAQDGLRLLEADSLHLTLCFLGSRPVGEIELLLDALSTCPRRALELSVGAPLWLPRRRPRSLAVEIHDRSGALTRAQEQVTAALSGACAWQPERRRFRPHITLARVRQRARGSGVGVAGARERALPATPALTFAPPAIVLYRSWLAPEGASYEPLVSYALEAG